MIDLDRLQQTYANPSNERLSGKTTMNCFNLLGYIDVLNTDMIIVSLQQYNLAWGFALRFDVILKDMGFEYDVVRENGVFSFHVKDCNGNTKIVSIVGQQDEEKILGFRHAFYSIDHQDIYNCFLDLSKSGIPPEDDDYSELIKA
mgnify:CR=1 FL=1